MLKQVQVETTNICNAHCVFCVHDLIENYTTMGDDLYHKIVDDCAQYPLKQFIPMLTGEPFCDPNIMARLHYARGKLDRITEIRVYCNGSLLNKNLIDELATIPNFSLSISLNGSNREMRRRLMGLDDFDHVVEMARYADEKKILCYTSTVWFPTLNLDDINALGKYPKPSVLTMQNWCGVIYRYNRTQPTNCTRATELLTILADGAVVLCCFDPFGKVKFGNMKDQTIDMAWNNQAHKHYTNMHQINEGQTLPLCSNCTQAQ